MKEIKDIRAVDFNTGEDVSQQYTLRSRSQDEAYRRRQNGRERDFTAANMQNLPEVYEALTTAQCGYLMMLQCYVSYDGGILVNTDKTPMTKADMRTILQLDAKRRTFYDFYRACVKADIIRELDGDVYAVNERYHFKGAFDDQYVVKTYTAKVKRIYSEVKAADIGLMYRMLPFIHMETNALCANPFERVPERIAWFNRRELAAAINVDPDTLGRRLPRMKFDGEYVVARIKVGAEPDRYAFNPRVFYRQSKAPDKTLQAMFAVKKRK